MLYETFSDSSLFDFGAYLMSNGKLKSVILARRSLGQEPPVAVETVVEKAIQAYGNGYESLISMDPKKNPLPTLVWRTPNPISLSYKPADVNASKVVHLYTLIAYSDDSPFIFTKPLENQKSLFKPK
jgi:hypothetical protein